MGVGMPNRLPRLRPGVEDDAVPAVADPVGHSHLMSLGYHLSQQTVTRHGERGEIRVVSFRYHQHMRGCLRANVTESNCSWRLEHERCRDIARHDPAE